MMVVGLIVGIIYLFWDYIYWAKWVVSLIALRIKKCTQRKRFDLYNFEVENQPEKLGVLVPKEEKSLESPFPEEHLQEADDEILFYGIGSKSEALLVQISRCCDDESEACVYLKLSDGRCYELEQKKDCDEFRGFKKNFDGKCTSFSCGGLQMYYLEPMRRWRIVYCGMLRERNDDSTENKSVFVKFAFIWTASSEIYDGSCDLDVRATADGMAKAKWNSLFPPVDKVVESLNFYCQSGVINGIVSVEDEPDKEMYLYGEKIRYIGKKKYTCGGKFKYILGAIPETGLVLHLGKASIPNTFDNMYFGYVVQPNGLVYIIQDGYIISNLSENNAEGKNLTVMIKAEGSQFELRGNFVGDWMKILSGPDCNGFFELIQTSFEIDGYKGSGFMFSGEACNVPPTKTERISKPLSNTKPLTVYFTDGQSELTGGKGSSLGTLEKLSFALKHEEFIVPRGIVVTTAAFEQFLTDEIIQKVNTLKDIAYGNVKGNIHEACKIVSSAIARSSLPLKIAKEIEEKLNKLFHDNIDHFKVAVRSSATGEDTEQMSAAGQMDTFLGVKGLNEIFTAVKKCWASQFGYIATEYKRQNGQILNSPMAVVIQEMVECEAAGVLFTCDPVTNNTSVIVISGNYGLGESVVSGSEEPDTIVLQKLPNDEIKIKSVIVGLKQHRIIMADTKTPEGEDTTITEDVPEDQKNKCCISEEMAIKLGKLSLKIEKFFKTPRDIEWGIKQNTIYILQSRPITTGSAISDYEIKHEFDGPMRCENEFYSMSNVGEVMPGAISPLGLDVINKHFPILLNRKDWIRKQRNLFYRSKYFSTGVVTFYNHEMLTISDTLTRSADVDSLDAQSWMIALFGRLLDDPELEAVLKQRKYKPLKKNIAYFIATFKDTFFPDRGMEEIKRHVFNFKIPAERGRTSEEIFDLLVHYCSHHVEPFNKHVLCSESSAYWNILMFSILEKAKGKLDNDVYCDFAKLLASSSNIESADVPSAMQNLAHAILKDIEVEVFRGMSVEEAQEWLETSTTSASRKYHQFIERHGHRCVKESDMYSRPWRTDPKPLIKLLQSMSGSCTEANVKKEENLSDILPNLTVPLDFKSRLMLKLILPNCRKGVRGREAGKAIMIKSFDNYRKGFQRLCKAMVAEGYIPDCDLIYFMTINEIRDLLETRNPRIIARANHRRKLFPVLDALQFPEMSKGRPVPINENQEDQEVEYVADLTMKGVPVSQGRVKAYARVATSLEEAAHLKPGEILVTYSTDIGWSPYFPIVAGVVTELGGLISHGAVVSREYGLPCVVGLHGATKQFVTGDYVLLDGNKGILQRLSPPEN